MAALRWGICSAGKISHDFLVGLEALPEEHKAVAVAARSKESAAKLAAVHNISQCYGSYEELAADPNVSKPGDSLGPLENLKVVEPPYFCPHFLPHPMLHLFYFFKVILVMVWCIPGLSE